ncbi:uncharacterized protein F5147DRAFT_818863 [Suillus discolor]|uniref:Uncharacterized protein n=1 Tax=Suillus discolor TaxID=1912936 RepID=A0A9P7EQM1_9AGAM|nr:uncharacterized protein F5147DRAFT_818863 [Suillus discolor]KAG2079583.1 hypothetical protein F5147DRAFT_818863 [Suillus discolor]
MVLTGGTFNDKNVRKVKKRFNVTWNDFVERVEVADVMKHEKAYHDLICGKDENMCGLDVFSTITHSKESSDMIERFIKDRKSAWAAKNFIDLEHEEQQEGNRNTKGKQAIRPATDDAVERKKGKIVVRTTNEHQIISEQEGGAMKNSKHGVQNTAAVTGNIQDYGAANVLAIPKGEGDGMSDTEHELEQLDTLAISSSYQKDDDASEALTKVMESVGAPRKTKQKVNHGTKSVDVVKNEATHVVAGRAGKKSSNTVTNEEEFKLAAFTSIDAGQGRQAKNAFLTAALVDDTQSLMMRAMIEGDGQDISKKLIVWMIQRFRTLVGVPLDAPLNGQLITQSPDEYHELTENDYFEALGIERLYAALVNAEKSPEHLIHLAHALGRAAKETNILSDSKPETPSLDPLPPTTLPRATTSRMSTIPFKNNIENDQRKSTMKDTHIDDGPVSDQGKAEGKSAYDTEDRGDRNTGDFAADADEDDVSMSDNVRNASQVSELHGVHTPTNHTIINGVTTEKLDVTQDVPRQDKNNMNINSSNVSTDLMDTEAVNDGKSASNNGNSSVGTPREGKRKKEDSVAFSGTKDKRRRGNINHSNPLSSTSRMPEEKSGCINGVPNHSIRSYSRLPLPLHQDTHIHLTYRMNANNPRKKCWERSRPSHSDPHLDITPPTLEPNYGQSSNSGIVQCVDVYTHIEHLDPKAVHERIVNANKCLADAGHIPTILQYTSSATNNLPSDEGEQRKKKRKAHMDTNATEKPQNLTWKDALACIKFKRKTAGRTKGIKPPPSASIMDVTRLSDGLYVCLKIVKKSEYPDEADIGLYFMSDKLASDPNKNCVIPKDQAIGVGKDYGRWLRTCVLNYAAAFTS